MNIQRAFIALVSFVVTSGVSPQASADFTVEFKGLLEPFFEFEFSVPTDGSGTPVDITIENANSGDWRIWSDAPSVDRIDELTINGSTSSSIRLVMGGLSQQFDPGNPIAVPACAGIREMRSFGPELVVHARIGGDVTGLISADRIAHIEIDGDLVAPGILGTLSGSTFADSRLIRVGTIQVGSRIDLVGHGVETIMMEGDLNGEIIIRNGHDLGSLDLVGGSPAGAIEGSSPSNLATVEVAGDIDLVQASAIKNAIVAADSDNNGDGLLDGLVVSESVDNATVQTGEPLPFADQGRRWKIGGSILNGTTLVFPEDGVGAQVIVNQRVRPGAEWEQGSTVQVGGSGGIELTGPDYPEIRTDIGGSMVGFAPFTIHPTWSEPDQNGAVVDSGSGTLDTAFVNYYGELETSGSIFQAERRALSGGASWQSIDSLVTMTQLGRYQVSIERRDNGVLTDFETGYEYRFTPIPGELECREVQDLNNNDVDVNPAPYRFAVVPECAGDITGDGVVNATDLGELLTAWGACPGACPADLSGDGQVDATDLGILLASWGDCPGSGSSMMASAPGSGGAQSSSSVPWILQSLGFSSVSQYIHWLSTLSGQHLQTHILELIELIEASSSE